MTEAFKKKMSKGCSWWCIQLFSLIFISSATTLHSQTVLDRNLLKAIYFQTSYPSSNGLGSGAAFIATAEGGEAVEVNPAGLYQLAYRELNVQLRNSIYVNHEISPELVKPERLSFHRNQVINLANLGFSFPPLKIPFIPLNAAVSIYKYEAINFRNALFFEQFKPDSSHHKAGEGLNGLIMDNRVVLDTWGFSVATRIFDSEAGTNLDIGISFKLFTLTYNLEQEIFDGVRPFGNVPEDLSFITVANSSDSKPTIQLGMIYRWKRFRLGMTGSPGRTFKVDTNVFTPAARFGSEEGTAGSFTFPKILKIWYPGWLGFGLAFEIKKSWEIETNLIHTWHSNQLNKLEPMVMKENELEIKNTWRAHIGLTKTFWDRENKERFKLRCGYYYSPNHRFQTNSTDANVQLFFKQSEGVHHITGGLEFGLGPIALPPIYRLWLTFSADYSPKGAFARTEVTNSFDFLFSLRLKFL